MIIQYYADSLGLSRPGVVNLNQRYIYLFEKWMRKHLSDEVFLVDRSKGAATISELYGFFKQDEQYIQEKKDILIIHEGICDCAPRPLPLYLRNIISSLPSFIRIRVISFIHKNRAFILKSGFVFFHTKKSDYERTLNNWLSDALKTFEVIYLFTIAPTNKVTEAHSPGLMKGIADYNGVVQRVVEHFDDKRIQIINVEIIINDSIYSLDDFILKDDGHHLTKIAHELCFNKLKEFEAQRLNLF